MRNGILARILEVIYLLIFIFSISLITTMHLVPEPALAVFRIPTQLREVGPILGLSWPTSLEVYHALLLLFFVVIILNGIGLHRLHISKWRSACKISSFLGLLLAWSILLFFMMPFILNGDLEPKILKTSLAYSFFAFGFFITDLLTFFAALASRKEKEEVNGGF